MCFWFIEYALDTRDCRGRGQRQDHQPTQLHRWLSTASMKRLARCSRVTRSPRSWTPQPHRADKGACSPHPGVGNISSQLTTLMAVTLSAKWGAWFSQAARQVWPTHALPSEDKMSPLGWKSLADCTQLVWLCPSETGSHCAFFCKTKVLFAIWESTYSVIKSPSPCLIRAKQIEFSHSSLQGISFYMPSKLSIFF